MATDAPTMNSLGKWYEVLGEWQTAAGEEEILLLVGGFDMD